MGMSRIETLCATLASFLPAHTPAAVVQWAGTSNERRLVSRLDRLAADAPAAGFGSPAVILIGAAVGEAVGASLDDATGAADVSDDDRARCISAGARLGAAA
jgi:uroporphyrin-III C-methyltransferase